MKLLAFISIPVIVICLALAFFFGTIIYLLLQIVKLFCNDDKLFVI